MLLNLQKDVRSILILLILASIYFFAWELQQNILLNNDVSWFLEASKRLYAGGTYTNDFFENNPPLILYLYLPCIALKKMTHFSNPVVLRIYVFALASLSLSISWFLIRKLFTRDVFLSGIFFLALGFLFLIFPMYEFGQREHLLIMLIMPYLLLVTCRINGFYFNPVFAMFVGVLAGLVFALKPNFLLTFILVELYYLINQKNRWAWYRSEVIAINTVILLYICLVATRHMDYVLLVAPYMMRWVRLGHALPWNMVIFSPYVPYCLLAIVYFLLTIKKNDYLALCTILALTIIGSLFSFIIQQALYFYHFLPAILCAILLYTLLIYTQIKRLFLSTHDYLSLLLLIFLLTGFSYSYLYKTWAVIVFEPLRYFSFFACVFSILACLLPKKNRLCGFPYIALVIIIILALSYVFSVLLITTPVYSHLFILTTMFLFICFSFIISGDYRDKSKFIIISFAFSLILMFPYIINTAYYNISMARKNSYSKLIHFFDTQALHSSIYIISSYIQYTYPVLDYTQDTTSASRFSYLLMLPGLVKQLHLPTSKQQLLQRETDKNLMINMIAEDIERHHPKLVLVDFAPSKNNCFFVVGNFLSGYKYENISFEYFPYLQSNAKFNKIWKDYHYLTTLSDEKNHLYTFRVYQRYNS